MRSSDWSPDVCSSDLEPGRASASKGRGFCTMRIERRFTKEGTSPYDDIEFRKTNSEIRNPDGSLVFKLDDIEVPRGWSQVASDVLAQKYFRKAGVPARLRKIGEPDVPEWLSRRAADDAALADLPERAEEPT